METAGKDQAATLLALALSFFCCHAVFAQSESSIAATAGPGGTLARQATQADPGNALRIYRPAGGFKPDSRNGQVSEEVVDDSLATEERSEPVFAADRVWASDPTTSANVAQDSTSPAFTQVLDGFSARWQRRLGTPVACAMVLCQGSCAASDSPCELAGSWRGESAGCADMPAGTSGASSGCAGTTESCAEKHDGCAGKDEACAGGDEACAAKHGCEH